MKKKKGTRLLAVLLAALIVSSTSALVYAADTDTDTPSTTVSENTETTSNWNPTIPEPVVLNGDETGAMINSIPNPRPTVSSLRTGVQSYYDAKSEDTFTVPVYMYARYQTTDEGTDPSMANGALMHEGIITVKDNKAYLTIGFNAMTIGDGDGIVGHLLNLWYYNKEGKLQEPTDVNRGYIYWDPTDLTKNYSYVKSITIPLEGEDITNVSYQSYSSDIICRVSVDAMGDAQQDVVLVIDWANIECEKYQEVKEYIAQLKEISNDYGKYTEDSYANLQNMIAKYGDNWDKKGNYLYAAGAIRELKKAKNALIETSSVAENGIYKAKFKFYTTEQKTHYFSNGEITGYSEIVSTDNADDFTNTAFDGVAEVTVKNGEYSVKLSLSDDLNDLDYYFCNVAAVTTGLSVLKRKVTNYDRETIDYFGTNIPMMTTANNSYVVITLDNKYEKESLLMNCQIYPKAEQGNYTRYGIALSVDWDSLEKIGDLPIDKAALDYQIGAVNNLIDSGMLADYTDESVENLKTALEQAKTVNENENATQEEVDTALANLQNATKALEKKPTVDTSALETAIAQAETISNADGKYTAESYASLTTAVENAKAVLADESKTQESVDNASTAVQTAVDGLVEVVPEELTLTATLDNDKITLGTKFTVNAAAAGGAGDYTYAVLYKKISDEKWVTKQKYSENATVQIKPAKAEQYMICVKAKDADGTIVKKYFIADVENTLKNTSTIPNPTIKLGERMAINVSSEGGIGEHTYAVYYKKVTDTKWIAKQSYSTNTDVSIKPAYATQYMVCVKVKDSNGVVEKKYFMANVE